MTTNASDGVFADAWGVSPTILVRNMLIRNNPCFAKRAPITQLMLAIEAVEELNSSL